MIRTLNNSIPPPRGDGVPYTMVRIEESDAGITPLVFSAVVTQAIAPASDPSAPTPIDISYDSPRVEAWIRLVFIDADGLEAFPTAPVYDNGGGDPAWIPQPEEVAPFVRARLKSTGGNELDNFTEDTRPTFSKVQELIADAAADVRTAVGAVPQELVSSVRSLVALGAAMLVELTHFPEQVARGQSPYDQYERLYDKKLAQLVEAAAEIAKTGAVIPGDTSSEGAAGSENLGSLKPSFGFDGFAVGNVYW